MPNEKTSDFAAAERQSGALGRARRVAKIVSGTRMTVCATFLRKVGRRVKHVVGPFGHAWKPIFCSIAAEAS